MKKLSSTIAIVITLLVLCAGDLQAQKKAPAAEIDDFLVVQGLVVGKESILDGTSIKLFKGNNCVDSAYTGKNGVFEFFLSKDYYYAMEFEKFGYEKSVVLINSFRPDVDKVNEDNGYRVDFEVELTEEIESKDKVGLNDEDWDVLDFPRVLISYESGKDEGFYSDSAYLKNVKEAMKKIKTSTKGK